MSDLFPVSQFMKQYNIEERELVMLVKANKGALVCIDGQYFVRTRHLDPNAVVEDIFLHRSNSADA